MRFQKCAHNTRKIKISLKIFSFSQLPILKACPANQTLHKIRSILSALLTYLSKAKSIDHYNASLNGRINTLKCAIVSEARPQSRTAMRNQKQFFI